MKIVRNKSIGLFYTCIKKIWFRWKMKQTKGATTCRGGSLSKATEINFVGRIILSTLIMFIIIISHFSSIIHANSDGYHEEYIQFYSDHVALNGSLLIPTGGGPHPAIILIHGAGPLTRKEYRAEAEIFANSGVAAFIYDKRTIGYSADGVGEQSRSYAMLTDDALAAVNALRSHDDIDSKKIGLWGDSEGGSVAPLAAVQSDDIAFLITVSASGVPPIQQTAWEMENKFRHQGITANSTRHSITHIGMRFLVSAGLFAEATYNPVPSLEQLRQPILAIWGAYDRTAPPAESSLIFQEAFEHGGNEHYTIQFIPEANHMLRTSKDGFNSSNEFAPGYQEAMTTWVTDVIHGVKMESKVIGQTPHQHYHSSSNIVSPAWYDSIWLHLGVIIGIVILFSSYFWIAFIRKIQKRNMKFRILKLYWYARILAITGIVCTLGFYSYFGYIMIVQDVGSIIIFGRPLLWLVLQLLSLLVIVLIVLLVLSWRALLDEKIRFGLLLVGGLIFIPWALYWQLFVP